MSAFVYHDKNSTSIACIHVNIHVGGDMKSTEEAIARNKMQ